MRNGWRIRFWRFYCGSEKNNHLTLNRKLFLYVSWEQTIHYNNQTIAAERCDLLFVKVYKYFKIIAIFNFLAIVCFNVDGIFDRRSHFVSNLIAYIAVRLAWEKMVDIGTYCRRRQYMLYGDNVCRKYRH